MFTEQDFIAMTGREPEYDDMERLNCEHAGTFGHHYCGYCSSCNKPKFMCGC